MRVLNVTVIFSFLLFRVIKIRCAEFQLVYFVFVRSSSLIKYMSVD